MLRLTHILLKLMTALFDRIDRVVTKLLAAQANEAALLAELAVTKADLVAALESEAASAEVVAAAQAAAADAEARATAAEAALQPLQAAFDADVDEDTRISARLDAVDPVIESLPPAEETSAE